MSPKPTESPETHRLLHTRGGVVAIPRAQQGVPLTEYFQNADLPEDIGRAVVYQTAKGPVLGKADPVRWNEKHAEKARTYASEIKTLIDEKGYYAKTLGMFAGRLADETALDREEMKAVIVKAFEADHGKDPFSYLQDRRQERGLPARDPGKPVCEPERG